MFIFRFSLHTAVPVLGLACCTVTPVPGLACCTIVTCFRQNLPVTLMCRAPAKIYLLWCRLWFYDCLRSSTEIEHCLWKEILSQQRIRHFKILQSIYFAYDVGIISSYSNRDWRLSYILVWNKWQCNLFLEFMALSCCSEVIFVKFPRFLAFFVGLFFGNIHFHAGSPWCPQKYPLVVDLMSCM